MITIHILRNFQEGKAENENNLAQNEVGRLVPDLFFYLKKALYKVKVDS